MARKRKLSFARLFVGVLVFLATLRIVACPKPLSSAEITFLQWAIGLLIVVLGVSGTKNNIL